MAIRRGRMAGLVVVMPMRPDLIDDDEARVGPGRRCASARLRRRPGPVSWVVQGGVDRRRSGGDECQIHRYEQDYEQPHPAARRVRLAVVLPSACCAPDVHTTSVKPRPPRTGAPCFHE